VGGQAAGDVVGDSGVQRAVPAAEDIDIPRHGGFLLNAVWAF